MITNPHTVVLGDTLWDIATEFYGEGRLYKLIAAANPFIRDPDLIFPGQILQLPDRPPQQPVPPPEEFSFRVLRPEDLVDLRCVAVGFRRTAFDSDQRPTTHTVVPGDTLSAIAARYYGDAQRFRDIARANHIPNPDLIFPGQVFLIPGPVPNPPAAPPAVVVHTVRRGDTLWDIAKRYYGDPTRFREIADANHIPNPDLIFPDQEFVIPNLSAAVPDDRSADYLVADNEDAHLAVHFASQNVFEEREAPAARPAAILAAADSRLVFVAPVGTRVELTVAGVLRVLPTLALKVSASASVRIGAGDPPPDNLPDSPSAPTDRETAIEAPYRLIVSPTARCAFVNDASGAVAVNDPLRISLWSARLAVRHEVDGVLKSIDESYDAPQRVVRALHARDDDAVGPPGFTGSLDDKARRAVVRQTSQRGIVSPDGNAIEPEPISVRRLQLSAIGATIDWKVKWDFARYPREPPASLHPLRSAYRHLAPLGRDAYVQIEEPGYLYPFGHRASRVEVTERQLSMGAAPVARLALRTFIIVEERTRKYVEPDLRLPFTSVSIDPHITPDLVAGPAGQPFVPAFDAAGHMPFFWSVTGVDHLGSEIPMQTSLVFVPESARPAAGDLAETWKGTETEEKHSISVGGAEVAMAPSKVRGDTTVRVEDIFFDAEIDKNDGRSCQPTMTQATVNIPALTALNQGAPPSPVQYPKDFKPGDIDASPGQLFLTLVKPNNLDFSTGSDRAGGFVQPSVGIRALSRTLGAIGDDGVQAGSGLSAGMFNPEAFLGDVAPKLFGLFKLTDILAATPLAQAPKLLSESLGAIDLLQSEWQRLLGALDTVSNDLTVDATNAAHQAASQALDALRTQIVTARNQLAGAVDPVVAAFRAVLEGRAGDAAAPAAQLVGKLQELDALMANPVLPAYARASLQKPYQAISGIAETAQDAAKLVAALQAAETSKVLRFEWQPKMLAWPPDAGPDEKIFIPTAEDGLTISVEVRATAGQEPSTDVSAQLRGFTLALLPGEPLMEMRFSRIGFRVGTGRKPEIDVVFDKMVFVGVLGFIEKLQQCIPFDGLSDPPFVDISPAGATAGFDLALPSVAVGVFTMENISLHADCQVPFLGMAVTVGFGFCCKESPFRLTVSAIGGGGWVAIRLCPEGLVALEMGLEAGASLSIDLGVASGSVSVMIGVYLRLEGDKGQLTGYFRIRGEVEVLEIASASITLELSLTYDFDSGKLIGRASVRVEVEVLFFSASVEISVERRFAGSKGDPALIQIMPPDGGGQDMWNDYFDAFAVGA